MNKIKLLKISVFVLLILNITFIATTFFAPPHPHHRAGGQGRFKAQIIQTLEFNDQQIQALENSIQLHHSRIVILEQRMGIKRHELFLTLLDDAVNKRFRIYQSVGEIQSEIEREHMEHFNRIKEICTTTQLKKYELLIGQLAERFAKPRVN